MKNTRKRFNCSYNRIELVITYVCNMRCNNCDAMVPQAITKEKMSVEQIKNFVKESIEAGKKWEHIRILGGEPTLHKDIFEICFILIHYKNYYSPSTKIQLVTNGYQEAVKKIIVQIPNEIEIENSQKTSNIQTSFSTINKAPIDLDEYKNEDFSKGCWIPSLCGITLDMHGYYPCSAAAAIDRVFGYDLGEKELPKRNGVLEKKFKAFCKLCGHFYDKINEFAHADIVDDNTRDQFEKIHKENFNKTQEKLNTIEQVNSKIWDQALIKYKINKPKLSYYKHVKKESSG